MYRFSDSGHIQCLKYFKGSDYIRYRIETEIGLENCPTLFNKFI